MKYKWLISLLGILFSSFASAQTVSNVVARQVGGTVEITYDLDQDAQVSLQLSRDGGKTYYDTPKTVTGDVGKTTAGHKKMVWNLFSDGIDWNIERARFKVVAIDKSKKVFTINGVSFTMILVEGGTFMMGATFEQEDSAPKNKKASTTPTQSVTLNDFYIGQTEVTQELWRAVMNYNPSFPANNQLPVFNISWADCQEFIKQLNSLSSSQLKGMHFSLPTEAQWEFAARGGVKSNGYKYSGSDTIDVVAWYKNNTDKKRTYPYPVAMKRPNELGLYDMSGNLWEFCQDIYMGFSLEDYRVLRGGGYAFDASSCIVTNRFFNQQTHRSWTNGLRIICQ